MHDVEILSKIERIKLSEAPIAKRIEAIKELEMRLSYNSRDKLILQQIEESQADYSDIN